MTAEPLRDELIHVVDFPPATGLEGDAYDPRPWSLWTDEERNPYLVPPNDLDPTDRTTVKIQFGDQDYKAEWPDFLSKWLNDNSNTAAPAPVKAAVAALFRWGRFT